MCLVAGSATFFVFLGLLTHHHAEVLPMENLAKMLLLTLVSLSVASVEFALLLYAIGQSGIHA
jgi:hypothetical protein